MNILFTCAGRRNYLINYCKQALNGQGKVLATDMSKLAPAMSDADISLIVPSIYSDDYIPTLLNIVKDYHVNAIISLNDLELPILSNYKQEFTALGAEVIISDSAVIDICFDKIKTRDFLASIGLKTPLTFINYDEALQALKEGQLTFPLVLKPRWGSASIGIEFPESPEEFELAYKLLMIKLKNTILFEASKNELDAAILIQQKLNGPEYGMDIVNDLNQEYFTTVVRKKLSMRAGETDKAISVIDQRFSDIGKKIAEYLQHTGNLDCDVFEQDGELYVLELNPRFGGGYPFSHEAGMNTIQAYLAWLAGEKLESSFNQYKADLVFSKCDRLIRI
ncbi:ATP-grasp domain-containing protein [Acinetobacter pseudolwoffii]|uniref:ATP-grasp domain-containing protein n=1 Tax=Acinetobacter pseudolwoffii TaxID=2053287 RepID=UPI002575453E|nr:ATP-grasp domain-containing protein [Acinetobacter pseudolwoffii]MDM1324952.1 ATP-grasp domain-containing protein [Acinetobacter pseudolwoffii]